METMFSTETSVDFQWTTQLYTREYCTLRNHRFEHLDSYSKFTPYVFIISRNFALTQAGFLRGLFTDPED
jgi:hypothetical protein